MNSWTNKNINFIIKILIQNYFRHINDCKGPRLIGCDELLFKLYRDKFQPVTIENNNEPRLQNFIHAIEIKDELLIKYEIIKLIKKIRIKDIEFAATTIKDNDKIYYVNDPSYFY